MMPLDPALKKVMQELGREVSVNNDPVGKKN
jgi:hypothetical protein